MTSHAPITSRLDLGRRSLTTATWGSGPPDIVFLHDGLGSIGQWRDVPMLVAEQTGRSVVAYDRAGHGESTPVPSGAWPADWLHSEAAVLADLLVALGIQQPLLVGHSDGGSIALLHAAATSLAVEGVVALAAHSWVEPVCVDAITRMRASPAPIIAGLARHHCEPVALFDAWSGVWTSAEFAEWDIRAQLRSVSAPVLVVQGSDDVYATPEHARRTAEAIGDNAEHHLVDGLGHLLHHDDGAFVVSAVVEFARSIRFGSS